MLKQSNSRNHKSRGSKAKQALQICLLLATCIWLIYQAKLLYSKKEALEERSNRISKEGKNELQMLRLGRKNLKQPQLDELAAEFEKRHDEEQELEDEENKLRENEEDGTGGGNNEINGIDQDKIEEREHEQLEDLIDEEDKD